MNEEFENAIAEYVLGTLPADERARLEERLAGDAELRAAVRQWQSRLSPLDDAAQADDAPRAEVWRAIDRATSADSAIGTAGNVVAFKRRVAFWRAATAATSALAAGLAVFVLIDRAATPTAPEGGRYIAVVNSGGSEPALIAAVDTNTGLIRIRRMTAEVPAGQSLELWHVAEGHEPRSLGLLDAGLDSQTIQDAASAGPVEGMIAVTLEPEGGSPSGAPTGPVVYSGRLIPVE